MAIRLVMLFVGLLLMLGGPVWSQEETPPVEAPADLPPPTETPTLTPSEIPTESPAATATKTPTDTPTESPVPTGPATETPAEATAETTVEATAEVTDEAPPDEAAPTDALIPTETATPSDARVTIEAEDPLVAQTGTWSVSTNESASGRALLLNGGTPGDSLTLMFTGASVEVVYAQSPILGTFAIEVDGAVINVVQANSEDASQTSAQTSVTGLAEGAHTLRIVSMDGLIALDTFTAAGFVTPEAPAEATAEVTPETAVEAVGDVAVLAATRFSVTTTADSGPGSLRQAILDANANVGRDTIRFNIAGCGGVCSIQPASALPDITEAIVIDGYSQPGSAVATNTTAAVLLIELNGQSVTGNALTLNIGASIIKGLVINRFSGNGVAILSGAGGSRIEGNFIGTDPTGTVGLGNSQGIGIFDSPNNLIGGAGPVFRNLISGNTTNGIIISGSAARGNKIQGNTIGMNAAGSGAVGNAGNGVFVLNARGNTIGGTVAAARNLLSGNGESGFAIGGNSTLNLIQGNYIGLGADGSAAVGNTSDGIRHNDAPNNTYKNNVISGNGGHGIHLSNDGADNNKIEGNIIGLNAAGNTSVGNALSGVRIAGSAGNRIGGTNVSLRNIISGNGQHGIFIDLALAEQTTVQGNYLGTDSTGMIDLGNGGSGIQINLASNNQIGGASASTRNIISGNQGAGISLLNTTGNRIQGNYIGTNRTGTAAVGNDLDGILVSGNDNLIGGRGALRNLISGNGGHGLSIVEVTDTVVQGNFIGTNAAGTAAIPNDLTGVQINNAPENFVGGWATGEGNLISGNGGDGITMLGTGSTGNQIAGNRIGTTANGSGGLGNQGNGIFVNGAPANVIGGLGCCGRNTISANSQHGVRIQDASFTTILNSYIGTDSSGNRDLGNGQHGVYVTGASSETFIGGVGTAQRNVISGNGGDGVRIEGSGDHVIENNYIGLGANGSTARGNDGSGISLFDTSGNLIAPVSGEVGNRIAYNAIGVGISGAGSANNLIALNSIFNNRDLGIDLGMDGVTPNDAGDADSGPNGLLNVPQITNVTANSVSFTLDTDRPDADFAVEFFRQAACDASGFGEGQISLGLLDFVTDANGDFSGALTDIAPRLLAGTVVTAVAIQFEGADPGATSEFSACMPFVTVRPPAPVLSSPANNSHTNDNTLLLTWKPAKAAQTYCVQVATDARFTALSVDQCGLIEQYYLNATLADGLYFWRVRAVNDRGESNFSALRRFTVDTVAPTTAPILISPADGSYTHDTTPLFRWQKFANAARYQLAISTNADCSAPFYSSPFITRTSFTLPNASSVTAEDTYFWCVRADDLAGNWGPYSDPFRFDLTLLYSPRDNVILRDTTPAFSWRAAPGSGVRYRLVINDSPDFDTPVFEQGDLNRTSFTLPIVNALAVDQLYFWTVQVTGGIWTTTDPIFWSFMLLAGSPPNPVLDAPANGARISDQTPMLSWFAVPSVGASFVSYTVQLDNHSNFSSPVFSETGLTALNFTSVMALPQTAGTRYYWRVRAHYCEGGPACSDAVGPWSAARYFTLDTVAPLPFNLIAPADTSQLGQNPPLLRWQASSGAVEYLILLDGGSPPTTPLALVPGSTPRYTHGAALAAGDYFWQVIARDAAGNETASAVFNFLIGL